MNTIKIKGIVLAVMLSLGATTVAFAKEDHESYQESQIMATGSLVEIGKSPKALPELKGFANNLPLIEVLRQITPDGWKVKKGGHDKQLNITKEVSWEGGHNWVHTLETISIDYALNTQVDWNKKEITISEVSKNETIAKIVPKEESKKSLFRLEGDVEPVVVEKKMATVAVEKEEVKKVIPKPVVIPVQNWSLNDNDSLAVNVDAWAKKAGYELVWMGEDYPVQSRVLSGNFDANDGPIQQLSEDYGPNSRVEKPLTFTFYKKTLVVENLKYEQRGAAQYIQPSSK